LSFARQGRPADRAGRSVGRSAGERVGRRRLGDSVCAYMYTYQRQEMQGASHLSVDRSARRPTDGLAGRPAGRSTGRPVGRSVDVDLVTMDARTCTQTNDKKHKVPRTRRSTGRSARPPVGRLGGECTPGKKSVGPYT
jgi:hypothetical protein